MAEVELLMGLEIDDRRFGHLCVLLNIKLYNKLAIFVVLFLVDMAAAMKLTRGKPRSNSTKQGVHFF